MSESKQLNFVGALGGCFGFLMSYFVSKPEHVKSDWCRISSQNFAVFTFCKMY